MLSTIAVVYLIYWAAPAESRTDPVPGSQAQAIEGKQAPTTTGPDAGELQQNEPAASEVTEPVVTPMDSTTTPQPAQTIQEAPASASVTEQPQSKPWAISLDASFSEGLVSSNDSEHQRLFAVRATFSYELPYENVVLQKPTVQASLGYLDEIDVEDDYSNLQNTPVQLVGLGYKFFENLRIAAPFAVILPTNRDDYTYLSFRGSAVIRPTLVYAPALKSLEGLRLSAYSVLGRSLFSKKTSKGGKFNPETAITMGIGASYTWKRVTTDAQLWNSAVYLTDGSRTWETYRAALSISFKHTEQLNYSLAWTQEDRTFGYDGTSLNVDFFYRDRSKLTAKVSYTF